MNQASQSGASSGSLYGQDFFGFVAGHEVHADSAFRLAQYVMTHGYRYAAADAVHTLHPNDRAAFETFDAFPGIPVLQTALGGVSPEEGFQLYVNSLGRLHIRPIAAPKPSYTEKDVFLDLGYVTLPAEALSQMGERVAKFEEREREAFEVVQAAMQRVEREGMLADVLERVIDHVEHVESVCFYVGDRFLGLIDRFVNIIDSKSGAGHLPALRGRPLASWAKDEVLVVAALHALFVSGRSVRFEEFNGTTLTAQALVRKLRSLFAAYSTADASAPGAATVPQDAPTDLFDLAESVRALSLGAVGKRWFRYRSIYGLTFQKNEQILPDVHSSEDPLAHMKEFGVDYDRLSIGKALRPVPEQLFFAQIASACLLRDINGVAVPEDSTSAATSWLEALMEKIVGSAVLATNSDYGMSSSMRNIRQLMVGGDERLRTAIHALTPADFFTCFVSSDFAGRLPAEEAKMIATTVQKRMQFNRWHFIPGNLERSLVLPNRHWYYPPVIPDIAIHADVHRAAHARARVKFSIRSPGPDASRPPLQILDHTYRGFYDVRVVRMEGEPYTTEDMLCVRRRTLWLEAVYGVLVSHLQSADSHPWTVKGFTAGAYLDIPGAGRLRSLVPADDAEERLSA